MEQSTSATRYLELASGYADAKQWANAAVACRAALGLQNASLLSRSPQDISIDPVSLRRALNRVYVDAIERGPIAPFRISISGGHHHDAESDVGTKPDPFSSLEWAKTSKTLGSLRQELADPALELATAQDARKTLRSLRQELAKLFYPDDPERRKALLDSDYVTAAPSLELSDEANPSWTIVYHSIVKKGYEFHDEVVDSRLYDHARVAYVDPTKPTFAFLLDSSAKGPRAAVEIDAPRRARLAYTWAHLADDSFHATTVWYQISTALITETPTAMFQRAYGFQVALAIQPHYRWALAHLGDFYRMIANGWGQSQRDRFMSYIAAIDYLFTATDHILEPTGGSGPETVTQHAHREHHRRSPWTLAHLGAALVNVRAFMGIQMKGSDTPTEKDQLDQVTVKWQEQIAAGSRGRRTSDDPSIWLIQMARDSLVEAQALRGFHYPWAQNYQGDALLILSALTVGAASTAQVAAAQLLQSFVLQPDMADALFEPGQLFRNPSLEFGVMFGAIREYSLSWQYAWIGMQYLFKFDFVAGVQAILGIGIMTMASAGTLGLFAKFQSPPPLVPIVCPPPQDNLLQLAGYVREDAKPLSLWSPSPAFQLPTSLIDTPGELIEFIGVTFNDIGRPTVQPLLLLPAKDWSTAMRVGMTAAQQVFFMCSVIVLRLDGPMDLYLELIAFVDLIGRKLGSQTSFPDKSELEKADLSALLERYNESLSALLWFGNASYRVSSMLDGLRTRSQ